LQGLFPLYYYYDTSQVLWRIFSKLLFILSIDPSTDFVRTVIHLLYQSTGCSSCKQER